MANNGDRLDYLLKKLTEGQATKEETDQLLILLKSEPESRLDEVLEILDQQQENVAAGQSPVKWEHITRSVEDTEEDQQHRRSIKQRWILAGAAAAVLISGLALYSVMEPGNQNKQQNLASSTYKATAQDQYLLLPDSSSVILAKGSTMSYSAAFGNQDRKITLSGKAYFDVKQNAQLPFTVQTGEATTTVLGTSFNVDCLVGKKLTVTVVSGSVRVDVQKISEVLTPNKQLSMDFNSSQFVLNDVEAETEIQWTNSEVNFNNKSLAEIVPVLEKRFGVHFQFDNQPDNKKLISIGLPGNSSLDTIMKTIANFLKIRYQIVGKEVLIMAS